MADKLPALHLYVQDYLVDTRPLSNEVKGFYMDLLCYMHKSSRRGFLLQSDGNPYSFDQLGKMTGCSSDEASRLLRDLLSSEVISATPRGIPFSRRMVRDEKKRVTGIKFGTLGWKQTLQGKGEGGAPPFSENEDDPDLGGDPRGGKPPPKTKHAFQKSPYYPYPNFRKALPKWPEAKCRHYFDNACGYSDANGGRYLNWKVAVLNWDRKTPWVNPKGTPILMHPEDDYTPDSLLECNG